MARLLQNNIDIGWTLSSSSYPYLSNLPKTTDASTLITHGTIHLGSFGSIGHAEFETAITEVPFEGGLDLEMRRGQVTLSVGFNSFQNSALFTGIYDTTDRMLGRGTFSFTARDLGALLQEQDIEPRVAPANQTVGDFVKTLIKSVPLSGGRSGLPILKIVSPTNANGSPVVMGKYYGKDNRAHFFSRPEPAWGLIQRLAKDASYVSYFAPNGTFYFGPRNRSEALGDYDNTVTLNWSQTGVSDFTHDGLHIQHNANRHAAFVVVVQSSNKGSTHPVVGTAGYINPQLSSDGSTVLAPSGVAGVSPKPRAADRTGMYVGLAVSDFNVWGNIPIYNHFVAGLRTDQANLHALGIAREVAAQEIVLTGKMLGSDAISRGLTTGAPITVSGTGDALVEGQQFVIVHGTHTFDVHSGFIFDFTAWKADEKQVSGIEGVTGEEGA